MNVLIYVLVGGLIGFLTTRFIQMNEWPDVLFNMSLGVIGAFMAGWIFTPLFGIHTLEPSYFSFPAFLVSLTGSALLLITVNFLRWIAGQRTH
ncbi:MAG: GlsB/YeaQ/YmgE family stress response membrane protein [Chloroflexi bacterium]|nr:GlsB/YeaQ/YmgE family stress response membrane protein [Chloroflexota bacterium]